MPDDIPKEVAANLAYYRSQAAVAEYAVYRFFPEEEYIFPRYFKPGDRLLDLACGMGRTTLLLHEMGMHVRGIDLSDVFIDLAKQRFPYLDLRVGSYECIEEPDASFPKILISLNGLDIAFPISKRITALRECARVLEPGGTLIFSSHNLKSLHWFSPYYRHRRRWKLRNCLRAFKEWDYVFEEEQFLFYGSADFVIRQAREAGLEFVEARGFARFSSTRLDHFFSPYLLYVFRRPTA